ncbi:AglZ/HisF2 family acetamidino modification protein [Desulfococcaceae bacterium HSG7]|nr:AglZ/HisF2 family acetamidino modification protein [Desulfococcaceae bacterium HSG7]
MLYPRIIPVLLVKNKGLVKTVKFKDHKYVGDPINAVRIFNEKEADELVILDIDATVERREPDYKMIEILASECRMPLCYGGGVKTTDQAIKILGLGVEKVAFSSAALENPLLLRDLSEQVGKQSVVAVLDVKKRFLREKYECFIYNAKKNTKICPFKFSRVAEEHGAGEIIINSVDNDGVMKGYDWDLIHKLKSQVSVPVTALGGAGSIDDIARLISNEQIIGAAAGSLFVFKGKYRAVLINYPSNDEKKNLVG